MSNRLLITPRQVLARTIRGESVTFIDGRDSQCWRDAAWKLPGAIHVGLSTLAGDANAIPHSGTLVVYGEKDWEQDTLSLVERLHGLGYGDVRILAGGYAAWSDLHGAVEPARAA